MASEFEESSKFEGSPKLSTNSGPVAWQWLDTAHFRKIVPAGAEAGAWRPLYARPAPSAEPVALETVYETIIQWDEGGGKRSRRELARRIVALYAAPQPDHREVMRQAIEALRNAHAYSTTREEFEDGVLDVIDTLRAALGERDE
jgi:hypothetical protein